MKSKVKYDHHTRLLASVQQLEIDNSIRSKKAKKGQSQTHTKGKNMCGAVTYMIVTAPHVILQI